jgi:hypothetical protein
MLLVGVILINLIGTASTEKKYSDEKNSVKIIYEQAKEQSSKERKWKTLHTDLLFVADSSTIPLYDPRKIKIDASHIYVLEWATQNIFKIDSQSGVNTTVGWGKGRGPGEFENITDFDIFKETLYVCDPVLGKVDCFDARTGKYLKTFGKSVVLERICVENDSLFLGKPSSTYESFLNMYHHDNGTVMPIELERSWDFAEDLLLDGFITSNRQGLGVYVFYNAGLFGLIDLNKHQWLRNVKTIESRPFPELIPIPNGYMLPSNVIQTGISASIVGNNLMIFSKIEDDASVVDVYELPSGNYEFSIKLPGRYRDIKFTEKYVYCLTPYSVEKRTWKINDE